MWRNFFTNCHHHYLEENVYLWLSRLAKIGHSVKLLIITEINFGA